MKTKKFVGYVPKGETIKQTLEFYINAVDGSKFGMERTIEAAKTSEETKIVKRTITLSWEDEPVKEKK